MCLHVDIYYPRIYILGDNIGDLALLPRFHGCTTVYISYVHCISISHLKLYKQVSQFQPILRAPICPARHKHAINALYTERMCVLY